MSATFTPTDELTVKPLTKDERDWVRRLAFCLAECPPRLELMTIGDAGLDIIDAEGARKSALCDGAADRDGIVLASVTGPQCHGVSG